MQSIFSNPLQQNPIIHPGGLDGLVATFLSSKSDLYSAAFIIILYV